MPVTLSVYFERNKMTFSKKSTTIHIYLYICSCQYKVKNGVLYSWVCDCCRIYLKLTGNLLCWRMKMVLRLFSLFTLCDQTLKFSLLIFFLWISNYTIVPAVFFAFFIVLSFINALAVGAMIAYYWKGIKVIVTVVRVDNNWFWSKKKSRPDEK